MRIEVLDTAAEVVVTVEELVVVAKGVVVSGHSHSGHGHPFGHPSPHDTLSNSFDNLENKYNDNNSDDSNDAEDDSDDDSDARDPYERLLALEAKALEVVELGGWDSDSAFYKRVSNKLAQVITKADEKRLALDQKCDFPAHWDWKEYLVCERLFKSYILRITL